jgi:ATP-binding cassette subfamily F protein 2
MSESGGSTPVAGDGGAEARAAARAAKKAAEKAERLAKKKPADGAGASAEPEDKSRIKASSERTATGILESEKNSRDIKVGSFSLSLYGRMLVEDTSLELNAGQRYGLLGRNGCGKSSLLQCIANREIPLPDHIDSASRGWSGGGCRSAGTTERARRRSIHTRQPP